MCSWRAASGQSTRKGERGWKGYSAVPVPNLGTKLPLNVSVPSSGEISLMVISNKGKNNSHFHLEKAVNILSALKFLIALTVLFVVRHWRWP